MIKYTIGVASAMLLFAENASAVDLLTIDIDELDESFKFRASVEDGLKDHVKRLNELET